MHVRLIAVLIAAGLLTACGAPVTRVPPPAPLGVDRVALSGEQLTVRTLAEGVFTLPSTLVSVGSGSLVSVGSGSLVSVGSGQYRLQAVGDVPVAGAKVAFMRSSGTSVGVAAVTTDAAGAYRVEGRAGAGVYMLTATHGGQSYRSLTALAATQRAHVAIDVATTMVTARLLAAHPRGDMTVLPAEAFAETVDQVREAIAAHGLPNGFRADAANQALAALELASPGLKAQVQALENEQAEVEARYDELRYGLQGLSSELAVPAEVLANDLAAALSKNPEASDQEVKQAVKQSRQSPKPEATKAPASPAPTATPRVHPTATPSAGPTATPVPAATATPAPEATPKPDEKPSATPTTGPTPKPSTAPSSAPTAAPTANPGNGNGNHGNNGNGNGNGNNGNNGNNGSNGNGNNGNNGNGNNGNNGNGNNGNNGNGIGIGIGGGQWGTPNKGNGAADKSSSGASRPVTNYLEGLFSPKKP